MKYRFADTNDIDLLVQLRLDFLEMDKEDEQYDVIKENCYSYFHNALSEGLSDVILAEDKEMVAGTAIIFYYQSVPSAFNMAGRNAYVTSVYVNEEYRRKGIATTMLTQLIDIANKKGYPIIMLNASEIGKTLYKKLGFTEIQNGMILNTHDFAMRKINE